MTRTSRHFVKLFTIACLLGCSPAAEHERTPMLKLPMSLTEISGLTLREDGRLLAVADELGVVYAIDFDGGAVETHTTFGEPAIAGDFEGIALLGNHLYLMTSNGELWRQERDQDSADFTHFETGLSKKCDEFEGLTATNDVLLLLCKTPAKKDDRKKLLIYAWSPEDERADTTPWLAARYKALDMPRLNPSGLSFTADGSALMVVAARQQRYAILRPDGQLVQQGKLPNPHVHRQTEGIVITPASALYLADEGQGGRGTITRYERFF